MLNKIKALFTVFREMLTFKDPKDFLDEHYKELDEDKFEIPQGFRGTRKEDYKND